MNNSRLPRGVRLHNPGNIRKSKDPWQGLAIEQPDPEFFSFIAPEWGIRAMARVLITYKDKHGIKELGAIIRRWAPSKGQRPNGGQYSQNTQAYLDHVVFQTGFQADQSLDLHSYAHMRPLVEAMIRHENGIQPYSAAVIDRGLELAGIGPVRSRQLPTTSSKAGALGAGGAGVASIASLVSEAQPAIPVIHQLAEHLPTVILAVVIGAGVFAALHLWRERRVAS